MTSRALANDRCPAKLDLVVCVGNRTLDAQKLAVFQKDDRVVAAQRVFQQPLGIVGASTARPPAGPGNGRTSDSNCPSDAWPPNGRCRCSPGARTGILSRPLLMYWILAIWLMISPTASSTKSANMKSIDRARAGHGGSAARPTNPRSQIGVSQSRTGPYSS